MVALDARKNKAYLYFDSEIKGAIDIAVVKKLAENKNVITDNKLQEILGGLSYQSSDARLGDILAKLAIEKSKADSCNWQNLKPLYIQPPPMG